MNCKDCGHNLEGNFCNNCGQSSTVCRIDYRFLVQEIPNSIFQLNRGLFFTVKELWFRPGHSIRDFVIGKRKRFYKPVAYFLVVSALYILITHLMGRNTIAADLVSGFVRGMTEKKQLASVEITNWIIKSQTYIILLFIPLFSFASYLAFKKSKYNYFEHLVLNLYIIGQQMLIYLILSFVITKDNILSLLPVLMCMMYNIWTYVQFFDKRKTIKKVIGILVMYLIIVLEILIILTITAGIFVTNK